MMISFSVDGRNCWKKENVKVEREGSSGYKVTVEGSIRKEDIICSVPDVYNLLTFLSRLFNDGTPVFQAQSESEDFNPMDKCD